MIRGKRRDAAPVVDAGVEDELVLVADEIRRCLHPGLLAEDQAGNRDRGGEVVQFGVGGVAHLRVRLSAEVLHDDFLNAVVLAFDTLCSAKIASTRFTGVSPMPIRMPVVKGTLLRPASWGAPQANPGILVR